MSLRIDIAVFMTVAMLMTAATVKAQDSVGHVPTHWAMGIYANPSKALVMDSYQRKWQKGKNNFSMTVELTHTACPADSSDIDVDFGYPTIGLGLKYCFNHGVTMRRTEDPDWGLAQMVDYDSYMGNSAVLYGTFSRPFFRKSQWEADYTLRFGVGYTATKYHPRYNIDNELIGSRFLIFVGGALHLSYQLSQQWAIRGGVEYWHLSNGALNRPNKGANFLGPTLGVVYKPYYRPLVETTGQYQPRVFKKYSFWQVALGVAAKTLNEDWQKTQFGTAPGESRYRTDRFKLYAAYTLQADWMYRYARRWASGIGADVFYGTYSSHVEEMDKDNGINTTHSPWSVGLAAKHQVYYHRLRLAMSFGIYLYRHMGDNAKAIEQPYYERIGVHYELPHLGGLTVGVNVKAHRTKADFTELVLVWPMLKKANK